MQGSFHTINDLFPIDYIGSVGEPVVLMDKIFTFPE
jgi:hypothetical protein